MATTKKDYKKKLDEMGIEYPDNANKTVLQEMYEEAIKQDDTPPEEETDEEVEEETVDDGKQKQATLTQCMRQLHGKKPFETEEDSE